MAKIPGKVGAYKGDLERVFVYLGPENIFKAKELCARSPYKLLRTSTREVRRTSDAARMNDTVSSGSLCISSTSFVPVTIMSQRSSNATLKSLPLCWKLRVK